MKFSAITLLLLTIYAPILSAQKMSGIVAHRGAWKQKKLPENSIASLREAIGNEYDGSEFDVRMTADDSLIVNHDPSYHNLKIENCNYTQLIKFGLSNGEKLPTLREYISEGIRELHKTKLIIEIKPSDISKQRGKEIARKVVLLVQELKAQKRVEYISFDYDILLEIHQLDTSAITQYLEGDKDPLQLKQDGISGCDFHFSVYQQHPDWITTTKKNKMILNVWTVNEEKDLKWAIKNGFDQITTNEPELATTLITTEKQAR